MDKKRWFPSSPTWKITNGSMEKPTILVAGSPFFCFRSNGRFGGHHGSRCFGWWVWFSVFLGRTPIHIMPFMPLKIPCFPKKVQTIDSAGVDGCGLWCKLPHYGEPSAFCSCLSNQNNGYESKAWLGTARYPGIAGFAPSSYRDFGCVLCWFSHVMNPGHCLVTDSQDWWYSLRKRFRRLMEKMRQREHIPLWISNDVADTCHISCLDLISSLLIPSFSKVWLCVLKKPLLLIQASSWTTAMFTSQEAPPKARPRHKISCCVSQRFTP